MPRDSLVARPPRPVPSGPALDLATELSAISAEFALDLQAEGGLAVAEHVAAAAVNLRCLTELLPTPARLPFLFICWQEWSREFTPAERIQLAERTRREGDRIIERTDSMLRPPARREVWLDYFTRLTAALESAGAGAGIPVRYSLYRHAHLTHVRLGIGAGPEAVAARALRAALAAGDLPPLAQRASSLV